MSEAYYIHPQSILKTLKFYAKKHGYKYTDKQLAFRNLMREVKGSRTHYKTLKLTELYYLYYQCLKAEGLLPEKNIDMSLDMIMCYIAYDLYRGVWVNGEDWADYTVLQRANWRDDPARRVRQMINKFNFHIVQRCID